MFKVRLCAVATLFSAAWLLACGATAQSYPAKPIRLVVPYAAGGATDAYARVFAPKYAEAWGQPVVV